MKIIEEEEPLMSLRPQSDFERLLWANNHIKELQAELKKAMVRAGQLQSEISELKDFIKKNKGLNNAQLRHQADLKLNEAKKEVKRLRKINDNLITDNIYLKSRLQNEKK